ncbi:9063_t:CDS:2, partial [Gigaspora rosea]
DCYLVEMSTCFPEPQMLGRTNDVLQPLVLDWFTRLVPNLGHISEQLEGCFIRKNSGMPPSSLILTT